MTRAGAVVLLDALAARFGGTAYAVLEVTRELLLRDDVARVVVVTRPGSIVADGLRPAAGLVVHAVAGWRRGELLQRTAWEAARLPALARRQRADAIVSFSGMLPRRPPGTLLCVVANPVPYEDRRGAGALVRRAAVRRTARWARAVYVPSSHMGALVGAGPNVHVVPLGVDRAKFSPAAQPGRDLLYVADFYAHKKHRLVLEAYARLPEPRPALRLIGNPGVEPAVFGEVSERAAAIPGVRVEGRVPLRELILAYRDARACVLASDRESFSMPLAEAMSAGVPAAARAHPTLRETAGPGALYVEGDDPDDWARALDRLIRDDDLHGRLRAAAIAHAERFSWARLAERMVHDAA